MNPNPRQLATLIMFSACLCTASIAEPQSAEIKGVSLVNLLANPESYTNTKVRVAGYLASRGNYYLFLSKDSAQISDYASAVRVSDNNDGAIFENRCFEAYMYVTGVWSRSVGEAYVLRDVEEVFDAIKAKSCVKISREL